MTSEMIFDIAFLPIIPLLVAAVAAYHIFPDFAVEFAEFVSRSQKLTASVLKVTSNGELVVKFRIESEKKTVVQNCRTGFSAGAAKRRYKRGDTVDIYFRDDITRAEAVTAENNRWAVLYEFYRKTSLICFAAAGVLTIVCIILRLI